MLINWFTVGAQMVNFIILVWLLRRFLYRPILEAIQARQSLISAELAAADEKKQAAAAQLKQYDEKIKAIDEVQAQKIAAADAKIGVARETGLAQLKSISEVERDKAAQALRTDQNDFAKNLRKLIGSEVLEISRKVLRELADAQLETQMVDVFCQRLARLEGHAQTSMQEALRDGSEPALIRTAFELVNEKRTALSKALDRFAGASVQVQFQTSVDLLCGVDLSCKGQRVAWDIGGYLDAFGAKASSLLNRDFVDADSAPAQRDMSALAAS